MWLCLAMLMLWTGSGGCSDKVNTSDLIEYTAVDFYDKLNSGKIMFVYFEHQVSPTISLFLVELEKSAEVLQDYGILVGKINCNKELVPSYCTKERVLHTAFLFRSGKQFLSFDLDTVFDVNSIVSEVLFAVLRDEVKYVHSDTDLVALEKTFRGRRDVVLGYVSSLGTPEHRSIMETAYVYGSKYQFILTTGGPVLKHLGVNESLPLPRVWFLHCKVHTKVATSASERCPVTHMRKPLSTLSIHTFLQLMEAPLLSEVHEDPSSIPPPQFPYQQTPQVFLFSHPETEQLDSDTARTLAWRLRGLALLLLVHRKSPAVKTPPEYNAAYRLPDKGSEVKFLTSPNLDELLELFTDGEQREQDEEEEEDDDEEGGFEDTSDGSLDDEVAASVYERRSSLPDLDSVTQLTSDSFLAAVAESSLTVVLFYLKWDTVLMAFISSFLDVADALEDGGVDDVRMSVVDCGEWTDLCAAQHAGPVALPFRPIVAFPSVLLLRPQETAQEYRGMLGSEALLRFILMSRPASPAALSTQEEVTSFLQEVPHPQLASYTPDRVLGLFETHTHEGLPVFSEAAARLRGEVLTGLLTDGLARKWAAEHSTDLPAVLVFPSWRAHTRPAVMSLSSSTEELLSNIHAELLHPLPELTVENLPSFLALGKALLLLFVGEEEDEVGRRQNKALVEEMRGVVELGRRKLEPYLACWIHLGRTPAAMSVLGSYLGSMPPLPTLLLTHLPSRDDVYQFPPSSPIGAHAVLLWLQRVEEGRETPAGSLGGDSWPPATNFHDFLKIMDEEEPGFAKQLVSKAAEEDEEEEEEEGDEEEVNVDDLETEINKDSSSSTTAESNFHSEL